MFKAENFLRLVAAICFYRPEFASTRTFAFQLINVQKAKKSILHAIETECCFYGTPIFLNFHIHLNMQTRNQNIFYWQVRKLLRFNTIFQIVWVYFI